MSDIKKLRTQLDQINYEILGKLNERAIIVKEIGAIKEKKGTHVFDPIREKEMLDSIVQKNKGPFSDSTIKHIFKQIFQISLDLQEKEKERRLLVHRQKENQNTVIEISGEAIGSGKPVLIAGPCSVETEEQVKAIASHLNQKGIAWIRGGAFKPRTSPYDFQGLGMHGLKMLKKVGSLYNLRVISEIMNPADIEHAANYVDVIQIGARNMQNFDLLKEAGSSSKPVLLKRGFSSTIQEYLYAAEYIMSNGNTQVILCERGIRTFEKAVRNNIDISAVPILKKESHLPVIVDVAHSGRKDLLVALAKAAIAAGADGIMVETHNNPAIALSDAGQQLDLNEFDHFFEEITRFINKIAL